MENNPVVIGIGDIQQKDKFDNLDEALILMDKAAKLAIQDSGNTEIKKYIDEIKIPKGYWRYRDPGKWIAKQNNISDVKTFVSKIGILQQSLINSACQKIISGQINGSLIIGGEARYKKTRAKIENKDFNETQLTENPDHYIKSDNQLTLNIEEKSLGSMAVGYYSILESAFRAKKMNNFSSHHHDIAKIYSNFSNIAFHNDLGWDEKCYSINEIIDSNDLNPQIAFPYNKKHCASWNVNQSAAILLCSEKIADLLEIDNEKRVYLLASSENNNMIPTLQRENLTKPFGMKLAAEFILDVCNENSITPSIYDLYSCFPIAVQMFAEVLKIKNISEATVTGGMSFAGGPLNSYVLNSTVQIIRKIRSNQSDVGIITGVSGMMTKQSFALWSSQKNIPFKFMDVTEKAIKYDNPVEISEKKDGTGKIIGYTVIKDDNLTKKAVMYIENDMQKRNIVTSYNEQVIHSMENNEWVGKYINFANLQLVV
ncbi:MAG: acetyl-CoA acetyltransferase [Gammaproteobacteria bacterium]